MIEDNTILILCGGKSSRMGSNKSLLPIGNITLLENLIGQLDIHSALFIAAKKGKLFLEIPNAIFIDDFLEVGNFFTIAGF